MPSKRQDEDFAEEMLSHVQVKNSSLDSAIDWIGKNLEPEDVFADKSLERWAESNGYIKEP